MPVEVRSSEGLGLATADPKRHDAPRTAARRPAASGERLQAVGADRSGGPRGTGFGPCEGGDSLVLARRWPAAAQGSGNESAEEEGACVRGLTFELSGPPPVWRLAREAHDDSERLVGQVPCRWRSARAKG
jgi:hypothetical protein